jgi:hypothetical protein
MAWILSLGVVGVLLFGGIAQAHSVSFPTSLSISRSPSGVVAADSDVTFSGKLSSDKRACRNHSTVALIRVGSGVVDTTKTGAGGGYSFTESVKKTSRWFVKFNGKVLKAVHPHNHVCEASTSNRIRVRVA